jgi:ABC-type multidrug transport system fused ATPase/permease subunit
MDEATSNIDPKTDKIIQNLIKDNFEDVTISKLVLMKSYDRT